MCRKGSKSARLKIDGVSFVWVWGMRVLWVKFVHHKGSIINQRQRVSLSHRCHHSIIEHNVRTTAPHRTWILVVLTTGRLYPRCEGFGIARCNKWGQVLLNPSINPGGATQNLSFPKIDTPNSTKRAFNFSAALLPNSSDQIARSKRYHTHVITVQSGYALQGQR